MWIYKLNRLVRTLLYRSFKANIFTNYYLNFHVINIHSFKFMFCGKHILFPNNNFARNFILLYCLIELMNNKTILYFYFCGLKQNIRKKIDQVMFGLFNFASIMLPRYGHVDKCLVIFPEVLIKCSTQQYMKMLLKTIALNSAHRHSIHTHHSCFVRHLIYQVYIVKWRLL